MSTEGSTKAILAALFANAGIAAAKFVGFLITGSSSMLAESVHSVADTSNQGLLLFGQRLLIVAVAGAAFAALIAFLRSTETGRAMRAVAPRPSDAQVAPPSRLRQRPLPS